MGIHGDRVLIVIGTQTSQRAAQLTPALKMREADLTVVVNPDDGTAMVVKDRHGILRKAEVVRV